MLVETVGNKLQTYNRRPFKEILSPIYRTFNSVNTVCLFGPELI